MIKCACQLLQEQNSSDSYLDARPRAGRAFYAEFRTVVNYLAMNAWPFVDSSLNIIRQRSIDRA